MAKHRIRLSWCLSSFLRWKAMAVSSIVLCALLRPRVLMRRSL
jgi:hypothetical protein